MTRMLRFALVVALGLSLTSVLLAADAKKKSGDEDDLLSAGTFSGLALRGLGPALASGRIGDLAVSPADPDTWYVAVASGGVWKTVNAGTTWTPIFDSEGSYSIGCLAIDPRNPLEYDPSLSKIGVRWYRR